jgi:hypothetical protein
MKGHKRLLERTNNGCYFSECGCGWSGGVWADRPAAIAAHSAHIAGQEPPAGKVEPVVLLGPDREEWRPGP